MKILHFFCKHQISQAHLKSYHNGIDAMENNKKKMLHKLSEISQFILNSLGKNCLQLIDKNLTTCVSLTKLSNHTTNEPLNKKLEPQRRFYSTKRKRQRNNIRLSKSTECELNNIKQLLLEIAKYFSRSFR